MNVRRTRQPVVHEDGHIDHGVVKRLLRHVNPLRSTVFWIFVTAALAMACILSVIVTISPALTHQTHLLDTQAEQIDRQGRMIQRLTGQVDDLTAQNTDLKNQINCRAGSGADIDVELGQTLIDIVKYLALPADPPDVKQAAIDKALTEINDLQTAVDARSKVIDACASPQPTDPSPTTPGG